MSWNTYGHPEALDWQRRGYFAYPDNTPEPPDVAGASPEALQYPAWIDTLRRAKGGDFAAVTALRRMADGNTHPVIQRLCEDLIGDAGPATCIDSVAEQLRTCVMDHEQLIGWCSVLTRRGKLADLPLVLDAFETILEIDDAEIIPVKISECLETGYDLADHAAYPSYGHYRAAVLARCDHLVQALGTDQALVVAGRQLSVRTLAHHMLRRLGEPHFPTFLRRVFEGSTGIDCSSFYQDGRLRPLNAAALLESFLESSHLLRFEDGVRHFFGHRVP